ncbi:MAG: VTC domain-containing protein [Firmicutes bacterium]|nr:VTC domain-containing protein [Bacillota bacterium]
MRHEYKHIINYGDYLALKSRLSIFMQTDKHSIDGQYKIRSIYFDDMNDSCYQDKINGVNKRSKYRLRYYNNDLSYNDDNITTIELNDKITIAGISSNTNMFDRGNMKNNGQFNNHEFDQKAMKPEMPDRDNMIDMEERPIMDDKMAMGGKEQMVPDFDRGNRQQIPADENVAVINEPVSLSSVVTIMISIICLVIGIIIVKKYHRYG